MLPSGNDSDTETLYDEPIATSKLKLGERGRKWRAKLLDAVALRIKISIYKAIGMSKDEIVEIEPGYYYDAEYHDLSEPHPWYRRNKSMSDLSATVGNAAGCSAWEYAKGPCQTREEPFLMKYQYF
jgi:hypothetical protein